MDFILPFWIYIYGYMMELLSLQYTKNPSIHTSIFPELACIPCIFHAWVTSEGMCILQSNGYYDLAFYDI